MYGSQTPVHEGKKCQNIFLSCNALFFCCCFFVNPSSIAHRKPYSSLWLPDSSAWWEQDARSERGLGPQQSKHTITVRSRARTNMHMRAIKQSHIPQLHLVFLLFSGLMMNSSLPMTTSPLRLLKAIAVRPTLRLLATQKCPPRKSTLSTILRLLGLLPCEGSIRCSMLLFWLENIFNRVCFCTIGTTPTSTPHMQLPLRKGPTSLAPAHRVTTKLPQAQWDTKTHTRPPVTTPPHHPWPTR